jgi:hypothetical protein
MRKQHKDEGGNPGRVKLPVVTERSGKGREPHCATR